MSRQDRATTERHAKLLRELIKLPANRVCADCKKNDARWASWNLSMGTHISKVKSIDLDIWQPEQIELVQKWGNKRANIYWEAHLKPGHVPPEHKIESFIRSKYESRRWAMRQPLPDDPAVLENVGAGHDVAPAAAAPAPVQAPSAELQQHGAARHPLLSVGGRTSHHHVARPQAQTQTPAPKAATPTFDLLGDLGDSTPTRTTTGPAPPVPGNRPTGTAPPPRPTQSQPPPPPLPSLAPVVNTTSSTSPSGAAGGARTGAGAGLFDLDFKPPTPAAGMPPQATSTSFQKPKSSTNDIMSLFSTPSPTSAAAAPNAFVPAMTSNGHGQAYASHVTRPLYQDPKQQQQQAIYGAPGSSNAPPSLITPGNGQAAFATWTGESGITSSATGNVPSSTSATVGGIARGMETMSMGFAGGGGGTDVWASSTHKVPEQPQARPVPGVSSYASSPSPAVQSPPPAVPMASTNHYFSSQDVWGNPGGGGGGGMNHSAATSTENPAAGTGFGGAPALSPGFAQGGTRGNTGMAHPISDPFADIWK